MAAKKKKSNNRLLYILLGAVALIIIVLMVGKSQGWVGKKPEMKVDVSPVEYATIIEKVSASGMVQPVVEVKISPEVPGEIIELMIEEGDSVNGGDFLLKIRPDNFVSVVERTKANLNQQKANLSSSRASLARAQAGFDRSKLEYSRQQKLILEKVISTSDFEQAEANYKIAEQDLEAAKQTVLAAGYIVKSAQASVNEALENLKLTEITAPMTGIVSKLDVELGETVVGTSQNQGTEMLRIADLSNMEVRVNVNENDIIRISVGDTAVIDVDSYSYMDKEFQGIVTQIANSANNKVSTDAVTEFEVRVKILNNSYKDLIKEQGIVYPFRPGMTASVDIITEVKRDILTVPLAAVTTRKPGSAKAGEDDDNEEEEEDESLNNEELEEVVFLFTDGLAVKTKVSTGISDFERIEITSGLENGQQVVSGPFLAVSKRLKDGQAVTSGDEDKDEKESNEED
ncbi:MAG: HlyD family secretion protein [Cyclobacteriaceae bacterium]|jgi:HlyD family secretion protein